jgi:hypothetical protein
MTRWGPRSAGWALRTHGLRGGAYRLAAVAADRLFDFRHGVDTSSTRPLERLAIDSPSKSQGDDYEPTRVLPLRRVSRRIRAQAPPESVLLDLGRGKGRVLMVAAQAGFKAARGVEFSPELCEVATRNLERFRASTRSSAVLTVVRADAAGYPIQNDENVFFMFNPFSDAVLDRVLENMGASLAAHPRLAILAPRHIGDRDVSHFRPDSRSPLDQPILGYHFRVYVSEPNRGEDAEARNSRVPT